MRWGEGSAQSLEQLPTPSFHTWNTNTVSKDTSGDSRGEGIYTLGGPGIVLDSSLAVCNSLTMSVIPQCRMETDPTLKHREKWPPALCLP